MRIVMTGGSGVLGRAATPLLRAAGHDVSAPGHGALDLFDPRAVTAALAGCQAVLHLATRIPTTHDQGDPSAWADNDRLRTEATRVLADAGLEAGVRRMVFPGIAFVYPRGGPVDETTPIDGEVAAVARSALDAEREVARFARRGGDGVSLRLGLLYGPGTGSDSPSPRFAAFGATLQIDDAARALVAALTAPSGIYNVVADGERVSNARFTQTTGWSPQHRSPITGAR